MIVRRLLEAVLLVAALGTPAAAEKPPLPDLDEVIDHLDDLYRADSSHGTMTMEVRTENYRRSLTIEAWSEGDDDALMVVRKPAREAGTATLRTEEGLWNYAPRADRLIRIPSGLLSESWMGSHFTNDDLMRETSYDDDYDSRHAWADLDGERHLKLTLTPKEDAAVVWSSVVFHLTPEEWLPVRADYYDEEEVVRRMTFSKVRTMDDRKLPTVLEMRPLDKPTEFTRVVYEDLEFGVDVSERMFTPRGVRRAAQQR
ncbi:MAG: outer membrane lipoprotein-sorting protein [Myxococcota bacterium]